MGSTLSAGALKHKVRKPQAKCGTPVGIKKWRFREVEKPDQVTPK